MPISYLYTKRRQNAYIQLQTDIANYTRYIYSKITEHIIYSHLYSYLESLCDQQHAFWPRRSCQLQLIQLSKSPDPGFQINTIFLDLSKAFNKVLHQVITYVTNGIRGKLLVWIQNFLRGRLQHIILDGSNSESHTVYYSVPQEIILAQVLYYFYAKYIRSTIIHEINAN